MVHAEAADEASERPGKFQGRVPELEAIAEIAEVPEQVKRAVGEADQAREEFDALARDSQDHRRQAQQGCVFEK